MAAIKTHAPPSRAMIRETVREAIADPHACRRRKRSRRNCSVA